MTKSYPASLKTFTAMMLAAYSSGVKKTTMFRVLGRYYLCNAILTPGSCTAGFKVSLYASQDIELGSRDMGSVAIAIGITVINVSGKYVIPRIKKSKRTRSRQRLHPIGHGPRIVTNLGVVK